MKKTHLSKVYFAVILALVTSLSGCEKVLDIQSTRYSSEENHWRQIQDARSGLLGVYSLTRTALAANNAHWVLGDLRQGPFTSYQRSDIAQIIEGNLNSSFTLIQSAANWRRFYAAINAANVFIEKAPQVLEHDPLYTEENLRMDVNQVKLLRAFAYFYMVRIWGDVPLILQSHDNGAFVSRSRTDKDVVLDFISNDILSFVNQIPYVYGQFPLTYYGQNSSRWNGVLLNRISAYALLSHIAAWRGDYEKVEAYTSFIYTNQSNLGLTISIISTNNLVGTGGMFFGSRATQYIAFPFNESYGEFTDEGHLENLTLAAPVTQRSYPDIYIEKDDINALFDEAGDQRHGLDTVSSEVTSLYFQNFTSEIPVFTKIKVFHSQVLDGTFERYASTLIFSRFEEIILLRAEALAALKRPQDAVTQLNRIRTNRGMRSYIYRGESETEVIKAVFKERNRELLGEGWYWYDQVRKHRLLREDAVFNELLDNDGIYWPIASDVLKSNKALVQNAYWL